MIRGGYGLAAAAVVAVSWAGGTDPDPLRRDVRLEYGKGKSVRLEVVFPRREAPKGETRPALVLLPPGGGDARMLRMYLRYWEAEAARRGYVLAGPEVLGLSLRTEAEALLPAVADWLRKNAGVDPKRLFCAGASNGGIGLAHAAAACPGLFRGFLGHPAAAPDGLELPWLEGKTFWILAGERDPGWLEDGRALARLLGRQGAGVRFTEVPGQGHIMTNDPAPYFDWFESLAAVVADDSR